MFPTALAANVETDLLLTHADQCLNMEMSEVGHQHGGVLNRTGRPLQQYSWRDILSLWVEAKDKTQIRYHDNFHVHS